MMHPSKTSEPIPGYVVEDRIGVGGYGEVWRAQAPGGLAKAIKFVYGYFDDERGARELKALNRIKQVRHPFLLSLERFEIIDGQLIIVTELADMSLKDRFEKVKESGAEGIPREELLGYLRDAADALDYMRENFSLQHLDVKPENLLLVGGRVKVADFGLVKELHDVTASLMGGLTPVYAPPEVFDGQPSLHSDQYSLAIVYQEMLTGVLPFPGRTPAQLASQHLHARPRISQLPAADQPIIAQALAKDPDARFASSRALIDRLLGADQSAAVSPAGANRRPPAAPDASSETTSIKSRLAETDANWQRSDSQTRDASGGRSGPVKTMVLNGEAASELADAHRGSPVPFEPIAAQPAVDLPPVAITTTDDGLRPTLFLGIGGTASRTLRRLRRRLRDRLGADANLPAMRMLLLDTDARNIYQATQGDGETALADSETMSLPLRNAHDYTTDSRNILQWLSRRWLYNIPRSLQTEGRRPLGRLALVDHAQPVLQRLRTALAEVTSAEALAATTEATGLGFRTRMPRVFLISSISGGTGGGMVLDVAYAVRKILADLGLADDGVCGILTHSTDRNPSASDLAIANAYACLSELQHYSGPSNYPGEPACGLPAFAGDAGTFPNAYFVHLGDDLNEQEFEAATDRLASYLYLDTVTSAGPVFDECRKRTTGDAAASMAGASLRSFGLVSIGGAQTQLTTLATELLCKEVVDHWRGAHAETQEGQAPTSLVEIATHANDRKDPAGPSDVEARAEEEARRLELDLDGLGEKVQTLLQNELGGTDESVFAKLRAGVEGTQSAGVRTIGHAARLLHAINSLFGPLANDKEGPNPASLPLRIALERDLKTIAAPIGDALRKWILELIDDAGTRIGGASQARQWFAKHLRAIDDQATEEMRETETALQSHVRAILEIDQAAPSRTRMFGARRAEKQAADVDAAILQVVRLRFHETMLQAVCQTARLIGSKLSAAGDHISDAQRELGRLSREFTSPSPWEPADDATEGVIAEVRSAVAASLHARMPQLVQNLDERLQAGFLTEHGGLRELCHKQDAMRAIVPAALRASARLEIVAAVKAIPIAEVLFGSNGAAETRAERLRACLGAIKPKLDDCGGAQRLLAILPGSAAGTALESAVTEGLESPATFVNDSDADLVFCYEMQDLPLENVAARLIESRSDFVQIAARLHTRMDVAWSGLAQGGRRAVAELAAK